MAIGTYPTSGTLPLATSVLSLTSYSSGVNSGLTFVPVLTCSKALSIFSTAFCSNVDPQYMNCSWRSAEEFSSPQAAISDARPPRASSCRLLITNVLHGSFRLGQAWAAGNRVTPPSVHVGRGPKRGGGERREDRGSQAAYTWNSRVVKSRTGVPCYAVARTVVGKTVGRRSNSVNFMWACRGGRPAAPVAGRGSPEEVRRLPPVTTV